VKKTTKTTGPTIPLEGDLDVGNRPPPVKDVDVYAERFEKLEERLKRLEERMDRGHA
jgi:hypothetical protein